MRRWEVSSPGDASRTDSRMWASKLLLLAGACMVTTSALPKTFGYDPTVQLTNGVLDIPHIYEDGTSIAHLTAEVRELNQLFRTYLKKTSCPLPFHLIGEECFSFILKDVTWKEARAMCVGLGGDLAIPRNVTGLRLYVSTHYPRSNSRNIWLGSRRKNGEWKWLSGEPIADQYWYETEPSGNGDCLAMFDGWDRPFTDFPCDSERRAVCQLNLGKVDGSN